MERRAPAPRSVPAGGGKLMLPAGSVSGVRRSSRTRSAVSALEQEVSASSSPRAVKIVQRPADKKDCSVTSSRETQPQQQCPSAEGEGGSINPCTINESLQCSAGPSITAGGKEEVKSCGEQQQCLGPGPSMTSEGGQPKSKGTVPTVKGPSRAAAKDLKAWGERGSQEPIDTFSSRIKYYMFQYKQLGTDLNKAKEQLREAMCQRKCANSAKRGPITEAINKLKILVQEIEEERLAILKSGGAFSEKMRNEERFKSQGSSGCTEPQDTEVSEEEDLSGALPAAEMESCSGLPAGQMTALPALATADEDEVSSNSDGGLLRAIKELESPVHLADLSFGDDLGPDVKVKKKKGRKGSQKPPGWEKATGGSIRPSWKKRR